MAKKNPEILIMVGSESDLAAMNKCTEILSEFGVKHKMTVASAHRSPERAAKLASEAAGKGVRVIVCGAGLAAHLAGAVAAKTTLPVIGVPMAGGPFQGLDSLLSTVQMPPGVPVATVAVGDVGAKNAAYLALRILALSDASLRAKLKRHASSMARKVEAAARRMEKEQS